MILIYLRNLCASTSIHKLVNWLSGRNSFGVSSLYVQLIVSFRTEPVKWGVNVFTTGQKQVFRKPVSFFHIIKLALNTIQRLRYGSLSPNLQWLKYLVGSTHLFPANRFVKKTIQLTSVALLPLSYPHNYARRMTTPQLPKEHTRLSSQKPPSSYSPSHTHMPPVASWRPSPPPPPTSHS